MQLQFLAPKIFCIELTKNNFNTYITINDAIGFSPHWASTQHCIMRHEWPRSKNIALDCKKNYNCFILLDKQFLMCTSYLVHYSALHCCAVQCSILKCPWSQLEPSTVYWASVISGFSVAQQCHLRQFTLNSVALMDWTVTTVRDCKEVMSEVKGGDWVRQMLTNADIVGEEVTYMLTTADQDGEGWKGNY